MAKAKGFSEAELEVMKVLWRRGSSTVKEVQDELSGKTGWCYTTVLTFIARLYGKGHLKRERPGTTYVYAPVVPRRRTVGRLVEAFVDRVFDGDVAPLMNCLSESKKLKSPELEALRKLLSGMEKQKEG